MKLKLILFFLTLYPLLNYGQVTSIKSAEITFNFEAKDVDGTIAGFKSESELYFDTIENSKLKGSVAVKSIKTGIFLRDWALKGNKYFNEELHPKIFFESTTLEKTVTGFKVQGLLTIKAIEKPMTIAFVKKGNRLIGTATVNTSEYGISIKKHAEDNTVKVNMIFTLD